jgi:hypothetical protein
VASLGLTHDGAVLGDARGAGFQDVDLLRVAPVTALLEQCCARRAQLHARRDRRDRRPARSQESAGESNVEQPFGLAVDAQRGMHHQICDVLRRKRQH